MQSTGTKSAAKNVKRRQRAAAVTPPSLPPRPAVAWLHGPAILASLWLLFYPHPAQLVTALVLLTLPLGLVLHGRSRPDITTLSSVSTLRGKTRLDLADYLTFPAWALIVRAFINYDYDSLAPLFRTTAAFFILMLVLLFSTHRPAPPQAARRRRIYVGILLHLLLYSCGASGMLNCVFDFSAPQRAEARVIGKYKRQNKASYFYYLAIGPWGTHNYIDRLRVEEARFVATDTGSLIGMNQKEGLLGIPWYYPD